MSFTIGKVLSPRKLIIWLLALAAGVSSPAYAQFTLNGSAINVGPQCYRLTDAVASQNGSVWANQQVDLNNAFEIYFDMVFGFDSTGGQGVGFGFHNHPNGTAYVNTLGGMGFLGLTPSVMVEFDIEYLAAAGDPLFDHVALQKNGNMVHTNANNLAGPFQLAPSAFNVADSLPHQVRVSWNPNTTTLEVYFDCVLRLTYVGDIVNLHFNGDNTVYWGWTGSTAATPNIQQFCITYSSELEPIGSFQICSGDSVQLDAGPGTAYLWSPAGSLDTATIQTPTAGPTSSTNYVVAVTDLCGGTRFDTAFITVADTLQAIISGDTTFCGGVDTVPLNFQVYGPFPMQVVISDGTSNDTLMLDANGNDANTGQPIMVSPAFPTTYTIVSVENGSTCIDTIGGSATVIPYYNVGVFATGVDALCNGSCDGIGTVNTPVGGGINFTYLWPDNTTTPINSNLCAGNYWVTVTETNTGCLDSFNVTIAEPTPIMVPPLMDDTICLGTNLNLTVAPTGGTAPYSFTWTRLNDPGTVLSVANSYNVFGDSTTIYNVAVTDNNNCPLVPVNATIFVRDSINATILANPAVGICAGDPVSLAANATGGDGNYTYNWAWAPAMTATGQVITAQPGITTVFSLTVSDGCGTQPAGFATYTILVDQIPDDAFNVTDSLACPGAEVGFSVETYNSGYTYLIEYGDFNNDTLQGGTGTYAYNSAGCKDVTLTVITDYCTTTNPVPCMVDIYTPPLADFSWQSVGPELTVLNPGVLFEDQSFGGQTATWFLDSNQQISDQLNFSYDFPDTGTYDVLLVSTNEFGCIDSIATEIYIQPDFTTFYIPNAFSPNDDGLNDGFGPKANIFITDNYSFKVYDRWGDKVFETTDRNLEWNGLRNNEGEALPQGVYVYAIDFFNRKGKEVAYRGHVVLWR